MAPISEYNSGDMGESLAVQAALPITSHYCPVTTMCNLASALVFSRGSWLIVIRGCLKRWA